MAFVSLSTADEIHSTDWKLLFCQDSLCSMAVRLVLLLSLLISDFFCYFTFQGFYFTLHGKQDIKNVSLEILIVDLYTLIGGPWYSLKNYGNRQTYACVGVCHHSVVYLDIQSEQRGTSCPLHNGHCWEVDHRHVMNADDAVCNNNRMWRVIYGINTVKCYKLTCFF